MSYNSKHPTQQAKVHNYYDEAEEHSSGNMFVALLAQVFLEKVEKHELKSNERAKSTISADAETTCGKYDDLKAYLHEAYLKDVSLFKG